MWSVVALMVMAALAVASVLIIFRDKGARGTH
jgi:hypothetical protein